MGKLKFRWVMFRNKAGYILALSIVIAAAGCSIKQPAEIVGIKAAAGEKVKVHYTCRTENGNVVDTTHQSVADNSRETKSWMFQMRKTYAPVSIVVGRDSGYQTEGKVKYFYPEIYSRLAHAVNGKTKGETYEVVIESPVPEGLKDFSRYGSTRTVRKVPVTFTNAISDFRKVNGREPAMGEVFNMTGRPYYKVIGINSKEVTFKMIFGSATVDTPWGKADVVTEGDMVITSIDAKEGTLVLLNGVAGKIIEVTDKTIKVDFGYPFGESALKCSVKVLEEGPEEASAAAENSVQKHEGGI